MLIHCCATLLSHLDTDQSSSIFRFFPRSNQARSPTWQVRYHTRAEADLQAFEMRESQKVC